MYRHLSSTNRAHTVERSTDAREPADDERRTKTGSLLKLVSSAPSAQEGRPLLNEVVELNMSVARSIASRYVGRGVPTDDLHQVAYAALVKAARNFRPGRGEDFLSYAVPSIRGEIRRYFRDSGWMVRPPRRIQELQPRVFAARDRLSANGSSPTVSAIAAAIDAESCDVEEALAAYGCFTPASLDQPCRDEATATVGDRIGDDDTEFDRVEAVVTMGPALAKLGDRDRAIVRMRFYEDLTQQEIGDRIGITQMQVSRLLTRILGDLREEVTGQRAHPA